MFRGSLVWVALLSAALPAQAQDYGDCIIEPYIVVEVGAPVEGLIEWIGAERGEPVAKGDKIARLESSIEAESLRLAKLQATSNIDVRIAEARVELAEQEAARARELESRKVATKSQLDIVLSELKTSRLELARAKEQSLLNLMELDRAQAILDRRTIRSPIHGIILRRLIGPGEYIYSQTQVAQIASIDPLYVDVFLPTEVYDSVSIGQMATVYPGEPIGGEYKARIKSIDQVFDAASDTFGVRLELPNPDQKLPAGVDCAISLDSGGH